MYDLASQHHTVPIALALCLKTAPTVEPVWRFWLNPGSADEYYYRSNSFVNMGWPPAPYRAEQQRGAETQRLAALILLTACLHNNVMEIYICPFMGMCMNHSLERGSMYLASKLKRWSLIISCIRRNVSHHCIICILSRLALRHSFYIYRNIYEHISFQDFVLKLKWINLQIDTKYLP